MGHSPKKFLVFPLGCLYPILWIIFTVILLAVLPVPAPRWDWEASSLLPVPPDFMYIMFPVAPTTAAYDRPDGSAVSTLDRAMTNSQAELSSAWISLGRTTPLPQLWVRRSELTFVPPPNQAALVAATSAQYTAESRDNWALVSFISTRVASGDEIQFKIRPNRRHVQDYVYVVSNGIATPLKMRRYSGVVESLNSLDNAPLAALIAALALAIPLIIWRVRHRRAAAAIRDAAATHSP